MFKLASAYVTRGGLDHIEEQIQKLLDREGEVAIVHGADFRVTDPLSIKALANLNMGNTLMKYRVRPYISQLNRSQFHPKMYLLSNANGNEITSIVGSSNLTHQGLHTNVEINVMMRGHRREEAIRRSIGAFDSLLEDRNLVEPWAEWISKYEEIFNLQREHVSSFDRNSELQDLYSSLQDLVPQVQPWLPKSQKDCVIKALQEIEASGVGSFGTHLNQLVERTKNVALQSGLEYKWDTLNNSVRNVLNLNSGPKGERLFRRLPNEDSRTGRYRLSDYGLTYVRDSKLPKG